MSQKHCTADHCCVQYVLSPYLLLHTKRGMATVFIIQAMLWSNEACGRKQTYCKTDRVNGSMKAGTEGEELWEWLLMAIPNSLKPTPPPHSLPSTNIWVLCPLAGDTGCFSGIWLEFVYLSICSLPSSLHTWIYDPDLSVEGKRSGNMNHWWRPFSDILFRWRLQYSIEKFWNYKSKS